MSNTALAQRYAQAFCELAHDKGDLEEALDALDVLLEAFEPALDVIFSNPDVSHEERHELLNKAFETQPDSSDPTMQVVENFCKLLVDKNRFMIFDEIVEACHDCADIILNRKRAKVETPFELDSAQQDQLNRKLAKQFDADILLEQDVSPELLAGLRIQVDDYLMNYSIKDQLNDLYGKFRRG
jgi:F-type H+-transporting ATPase subunit delta